MAQLMQPYNPVEYDPTQGSGQFPVGLHDVMITKSEVKPAKGGESGLVECVAIIQSGEHSGVSGPIRFNLYNKSADATNIAHRQFSALCHVVGVLGVVTNTEALHNRPFKIEVGLQRGEDAAAKGYTEVKKFYDAQGNEPRPGQAGGGGNQNNSGFGNNNNQGNNGQQQQNNGNNNNGGGGFGQQNQDQQQNNNGNSFGNQGNNNNSNNNNNNNGGGNGNWSQGNNGNNNQGNNGGGQNNGGNAGGGWGQQRS